MPEPFKTLAAMRRDAEQVFRAGLVAVDPAAAVRRHCRRERESLIIDGQCYPLSRYRRIVLLGAGKAGATMAQAMEDLLGDRLDQGLVVVKYGHLAPVRKVTLLEAAHPIPDQNGLMAARTMLDLAQQADEHTLVIYLVSGGGSALMPLPVAGVSLEDKQHTTRELLACGATIHEINALRKHLSAIKGGQLARAVFPATLVSLILSDVIGDDLETIASGPCVPDTRTYAECLEILDKYQLFDRLPQSVLAHLRKGVAGEVPETPKPGDKVFERTANLLVGNNYVALDRARQTAAALGYNVLILSSSMEGETAVVAGTHMAIAREILKTNNPLPCPACLLSGGETTVTIRGKGLGGRNQEFALAAAEQMPAEGQVVLLSAGTDGTDGPTDAAGAFADTSTRARAEGLGLDLRASLAENDSYHFFEQIGDLFKTGPTNTNVMDLRLVLVRQ